MLKKYVDKSNGPVRSLVEPKIELGWVEPGQAERTGPKLIYIKMGFVLGMVTECRAV